MLDVLLVGAEDLENLGTRYLAAVLRQHGHTAELVSFSTAAEAQAVIQRATAVQPRVIGLSVIFQYRAPEFLALGAELKAALPGVHITCGGHFPTFAAGELLRDYPQLDSVVRGEGEFTLLELVQTLDSPARWSDIRGLSYRHAGQVRENPSRPLIPDLDSLPFPVRDVPPEQHLGIGFSPVLGSRGCHRSCAFCSISSFYGASEGSLQRFRSAANLAEEMRELQLDHNVRFFIFNDDEWFPAGQQRWQRVDELEREFARRGVNGILSIKCRADDVEESLFRRLLDMGVARAYVGVESGSDRSLRTLNKRTTVAQNRQALEVLHRVGMLADFGLIFFDPDSTVQDVRDNLDFFWDMAGEGQAPLSFGRMEVYAGTPILRRLLKEGRLDGDYMAWNYTIADPRVELLFRLMYAVMRHRHYDNGGLSKQCSVACYEATMYRYLLRGRLDGRLLEQLRGLVARANRHSLGVLGEMLNFTLEEDIHDARRVNDQAEVWATRVNSFDIELLAELSGWKAALSRAVEAAA